MKRICYLLLLLTLSMSAQEVDLSVPAGSLKHKIHGSKGSERLMWMDSLARLVEGRADFQYDSIARQTIDYAVELDSTRLALEHAIPLLDHITLGLGKPEEAIEFFNNLRDRIPRDHYFFELSEFYSEGAYSNQVLHRYAESLDLLEQAYGFSLQINDRTELGVLKEKMGKMLCFMGEFQESAAALEEAHQILKDHSIPELTWRPKETLAILYSQNGLQAEARKMRMEIIEEARKYGEKAELYDQFYNQAFDEMLHGSPREQLRYLDSARVYTFIPEHNEFIIQESLVAQLGAYAENGMLEKAEAVKQELDEQRKDSEHFEVKGYNLAMAHYEFAKGNYKRAALLGEREYANMKNTRFYEGIYMAHGFLARAYDSLGDLGRAHEHLRAHHRIKDSVGSVQKANGFSYYQALYEAEKKDSEIAAQQSEIELLNARNKAKNMWLTFGGLGILATFLILYLVWVQYSTKKKQQAQARFSRSLIKGQEEERSRVARELHDGVGQKLMLLAKRSRSGGDAEVKSLAMDTLEELRSVSRHLHPATLEKLGFSGAVKAIIDEADANTDIFFTHSIEDVDNLLSEEESLQLYRIMQELLNNIMKHSGARAVSVDVKRSTGAIEMTVSDNGKGFSFKEKLRDSTSLGMQTLLERAEIAGAKLHVESGASMGTTVSLEMAI